MSTAPSPVRRLSNAANAQLSTGPRTEKGKARSSQNARKHGLTAKTLLIGDDAREEFEEMLAQYQAEIQPEGPIEQCLFEELVASAWNLRRIHRMEAALISQTAGLLDLLDNQDIQQKLDRLARHHTRIERTFHRSLRELKALHTDAAIAATLLRESLENAPPLASATQIAKRSQALTQGGNERMIRRVLEAVDIESLALAAAARSREHIADIENKLKGAAMAPAS